MNPVVEVHRAGWSKGLVMFLPKDDAPLRRLAYAA